jgi:acyl-CoA synthetase (AMP-forming)/AMP-acid ligase II
MTPFYCKGRVVLNRKFKSATFWRRAHEERVTCVSVVPTLLEFLLDADEDWPPTSWTVSVRSSAERVPCSLIQRCDLKGDSGF